MLRIAIVEDQQASADLLQKYIQRYENRANHQCTCDWYRDGMDFISDYKPVYDIIFMDINMPHLDGMKSSRRLRETDPNVALIFVTELKQYAIKGYEVNALDFIVKPIEYYEFEMKFSKAIEYIHKHQNASIAINMGASTRIISLVDLFYVEVLDHRLIYHTKKGDFDATGQLGKIEESLEAKGFVRCSHSYLVNLRHVTEVHAEHAIVGHDNVPISRRKRKEFMQKLANHLSGGIV